MSPRAIAVADLPDESKHVVFRQALHDAGIPQPILEYKFAFPERKWAMDYAWPAQKVALEVEGGVWTKGRHTRGTGFLRDMEKYNRATLLGWRVVRCTPDTLVSVETLDMLRGLLLSDGLFGFEEEK